MFELRLKVILSLLGVVVVGLVVRAASVQLFHKDYWEKEAVLAMTRPHYLSTTRGRILDRGEHVLAEDQPCIDACVDYRAIPTEPDEAWIRAQAIARLQARLGDPYDAPSTTRAEKEQMRKDEIVRVHADIDKMWSKLAEVSGRSLDDIDDVRASITQKVQWNRRLAWAHSFDAAKKSEASPDQQRSAWKQWLLDGDKDTESDMDKFAVKIVEQFEPHVILPALDNEAQNELGKHLDEYPGLVLRPGTHRYYPYREVGAHLLGNLARIDPKDIKKNHDFDKDELRHYRPNDLMGKIGLEALCEPTLRGSLGKTEQLVGDNRIVSTIPPIPGRDVRLSIDIELQRRIQDHFAHAQILGDKGQVDEPDAMLHGAAIVIDVNSAQVRAMVSYPTYDENRLNEQYVMLASDGLNHPLMNRATMEQAEPGSTAKPMVGLAAITSGVQAVDSTIECTGFLKIGSVTYTNLGRCWTAAPKFVQAFGVNGVSHHPYPVPHPTGYLTFSDGLERSCNVFFETTADRLGIVRLSDWFGRFGLGRVTGVGILEARGRLPMSSPNLGWRERSAAWFAGIGEGVVTATPIQMANVAATIARRGIWMRPKLLENDSDGQLGAAQSNAGDVPDRVDMHLDPAAIDAAIEGMFRVVNSKAGTGGKLAAGDELLLSAAICGKTGTAQTSPVVFPVLDGAGKPMYDDADQPMMQLLPPSTAEHPNPSVPWYRGTEGSHMCHAWYIGFAPREHPQIAFAVLVDYGRSGGVESASVARSLLHDCITMGYLRLPGAPAAPLAQTSASGANAQ